MRVVRSYGSSTTAHDHKRRVIPRPKHSANDAITVRECLENNPKAVIAIWMSVIDKIATKPIGKNAATPQQYQLRDKLGEAAWPMVRKRLAADAQQDQNLYKRLWEKKIHPYVAKVTGEQKERLFQQAKPGRLTDPRGKWYQSFVGDVAPDELDARDFESMAQKIEQHIYQQAIPYVPRGAAATGGKAKPRGRLDAMIHAVENSVHKYQPSPIAGSGPWSEDDENQYLERAGKLTNIIRPKPDNEGTPRKQANGKQGKSRQRAPKWTEVVSIMHKAYGKVFVNDEGRLLSIKEAKQEKPGLFALHAAIKDTYRALLKDSRVPSAAKAKRLPLEWEALIEFMHNKRENRKVNDLIRLGRIIHYESGDSNAIEWLDSPDNRENIKNSGYWLSEGQHEIKRNEALVRAWQRVMAMAGRTLHDWIGEPAEDMIADEHFSDDRYESKLFLIFGQARAERAGLFQGYGNDQLHGNIQEAFRNGWQQMRNNSFHFKNSKDFVNVLAKEQNTDSCFAKAAEKLWEHDYKARNERLADILQAASFDQYATEEQAEECLKHISGASPIPLPLPKFSRVLQRVADAWSSEIALPKKHSGEAYEDSPWLSCQYTALKLLYERPFSNWVDDKDHRLVNGWIKHSEDRAIRAAQELNNDAMAVARMADLIWLEEGDTIREFTNRIFAHAASEMRVQRKHEPNAGKARKQASYIEALRCDVMARAFHEYLAQKGFGWLLEDSAPDNQSYGCDLNPPAHEAGSNAKPWMARLYALIHLVPVEEINMLSHQLKKSCVSTESGSSPVNDLLQALDLYSLMHDAHFIGEAQHMPSDYGWIRGIYENPACMDDTQQQQYVLPIPYRGLREMQRLGSQAALKEIFENEGRVTQKHWYDFLESEETISDARKEREKLHAALVGTKVKERDMDMVKQYKSAQRMVEKHRKGKDHCHLVNHVRLHRLLMRVLARMSDYAVLWERDMYFVLLAGISMAQDNGKGSEELYDKELPNKLNAGDVMAAYRLLHEGRIKGYIEVMFDKGNNIDIRNDLAHFNMLRMDISLTKEINRMRKLMSYDRKLKNAVSKSINELLQREGLRIEWYTHRHHLMDSTIYSDTIRHLRDKTITENKHSMEFVRMVARLFPATPYKSKKASQSYVSKKQKKLDIAKKYGSRRISRENDQKQPEDTTSTD